MAKIIKGYKGFDKNFKCRGLKYTAGKTTTHKGKLKLCESGLHFCENPLDVLDYYDLIDGRFAEVEAEGVDKEKSNDSKRVAKTLHIKAALDLSAFVKASVDFLWTDTNKGKKKTSGDYSQLASSGYYSQLASSGDSSVVAGIGHNNTAKATKGSWIVLAEWVDNKPKYVKSVKVDGKKIKADTLYKLSGGKFVEVK